MMLKATPRENNFPWCVWPAQRLSVVSQPFWPLVFSFWSMFSQDPRVEVDVTLACTNAQVPATLKVRVLNNTILTGFRGKLTQSK